MKETPYDVELKSLLGEQARINQELGEVRLKRAKFLCPFEIGDTLIDRKGKKARIVSINSGYGDYALRGAIIRKDGKPGRITRLYSWDDWKKEE